VHRRLIGRLHAQHHEPITSRADGRDHLRRIDGYDRAALTLKFVGASGIVRIRTIDRLTSWATTAAARRISRGCSSSKA